MESDFARRIVNFLQLQRNQTSKPSSISNALGIDKKDLNVELYRLQKRGVILKTQESNPPLWSLSGNLGGNVGRGNSATASSRKTKSRVHNSKTHSSKRFGHHTAVKSKYNKRDKFISQLAESVLTVLQSAERPLKPIEISKELKLNTSSEINPTLYFLESRGLIIRTSNKPLRWSIAFSESMPESYPQSVSVCNLEYAGGYAASPTMPSLVNNTCERRIPSLLDNMPDFVCRSPLSSVTTTSNDDTQSIDDFPNSQSLEISPHYSNSIDDSTELKLRADLSDTLTLNQQHTTNFMTSNLSNSDQVLLALDSNPMKMMAQPGLVAKTSLSDKIVGHILQDLSHKKFIEKYETAWMLKPACENYVKKLKQSVTSQTMEQSNYKSEELSAPDIHSSMTSSVYSHTDREGDIEMVPSVDINTSSSDGDQKTDILSEQSFTDNEKVLLALDSCPLSTASEWVLSNKMSFSEEQLSQCLKELSEKSFIQCLGRKMWVVSNPAGKEYVQSLCPGNGQQSEEGQSLQEKSVDNGAVKVQVGSGSSGKPLSPLELLSKNSEFGRTMSSSTASLFNPNSAALNSSPYQHLLDAMKTSVAKTDVASTKKSVLQTPAPRPSVLNTPSRFSDQPRFPFFQIQPGGQAKQHSLKIPPTPSELLKVEQRTQNTGQSSLEITHNSSSSFFHKSTPSVFSSHSTLLGGFQQNSNSSQYSSPGGYQPQPMQSSTSSSMNSFSQLPGFNPQLQLTTETFAAVNKNPISALMEYAQSRKTVATIEVLSSRGPSHRPSFEMAAFVGRERFPSVIVSNKKDGKKEAADIALRTLIVRGQYNMDSGSSMKAAVPSAEMTHFDRMAALSHQAFNQLIANIMETFAGRKVIAALIMKKDDTDLGTVISVGSGNRCITGHQLSLEGNTVNDSHAEIITRRGFIRFLYKQIADYQPGKHQLLTQSSNGKLKIKDGITFHLYISTAPCGDGALFSPRDTETSVIQFSTDRSHNPTFTNNVQGVLRTKVEGGEGTIPIEPGFKGMTFDGIQRGERLLTMSCSDKICRWNVVGLQGALLSHFLDPIYLDSLTLGYLYDHGHLARACCCRVSKGETDVNSFLPQGYHMNHPWLGRVTACDPPRETQKTKSLSINWVYGDDRPEVLDGTQGRCYSGVEKTFFSRLSKKNLYEHFKETCHKLGRKDLLEVNNYHEAKQKAENFQKARQVMLKQLKENKFGVWVSKPVEEEMFN